MDALTRLADRATDLARSANEVRETHLKELEAVHAEKDALKAEIERLHRERATAIQDALSRMGRNPDTSRAMEESFEEGRRAGLAEAAGMVESYVFHSRTGEPIKLAIDPDYIPAVQAWLAEHIRARAEGQEEPERVSFDPRAAAA